MPDPNEPDSATSKHNKRRRQAGDEDDEEQEHNKVPRTLTASTDNEPASHCNDDELMAGAETALASMLARPSQCEVAIREQLARAADPKEAEKVYALIRRLGISISQAARETGQHSSAALSSCEVSFFGLLLMSG